jgi:hypothetical protein
MEGLYRNWLGRPEECGTRWKGGSFGASGAWVGRRRVGGRAGEDSGGLRTVVYLDISLTTGVCIN